MFGQEKRKTTGWSKEQLATLRKNPQSSSGVEQVRVSEITGIRHEPHPRLEDRTVVVQFADSEGRLRELAVPFEEAMTTLLKGLLTIEKESGYLPTS